MGAGLAIGLQLVVLYAPRAPQVDSGGLPLDKLVHVLVFAVPTWALVLAGLPRSWAVGLMAAQAVLSEVVQHQFLADRSGDPLDVLADLIGVGIGALLVGGRRVGGGPAASGVG